jgi:CHAT domain-containing protein
LNLGRLLDPERVWNYLQGNEPIAGFEDEAYLGIALEHYLIPGDKSTAQSAPLRRLAQSLKSNHEDLWLLDFLRLRFSSSANILLFKAIQANHHGSADVALQSAVLAKRIYLRIGNQAGVLLSEFERVYALRRLSQSAECLQLAPVVARLSSQLHYRWIEIQTTIEQGSCAGMRAEADTAGILAERAIEKAAAAGYKILHLRALGLRGNLDMVEGRSDASWINNEEGLERFWQNVFPDERAFQFYYNLQVDAEKNGITYLALTLQRETLLMIAEKGRFDFEAMAHFRMAAAAETVGDRVTAQSEIALYEDLISKLDTSDEVAKKAKALYEAYCEVGLARLSLQSGSSEDSRQHLIRAAPVVSRTKNFMLRLEALKTWAELDRSQGNPADEQKDLGEIMAIANDGFRSLKSVTDRWRWRRVTEETYRRLLEIELSSPHSSAHALGYWELYRQMESSASQPPVPSTALANVAHLGEERISSLHNETFVSYAVLSAAVIAWVADDRGIREFKLPVKPADLRNESLRFFSLCSDPHSTIEKVNASASRLYEWLVAPIERELPKDREIRIEPDIFLGLVPWAALRTLDGSYWGSVRVLAISPGLFAGSIETAGNAPIRNVTIAIPNSLRLNGQDYLQPVNVDEEAAELANLYPGTKELRGSAASIANIVKELPEADVFEFAGHAVTHEHGGELVVQGENGADMLSGGRLATLRLQKTRLVVLSACSTGSGRDADRDPNGLVRSLLNAGVANVIATRWDVDSDATAKGMEQFYRSLKAGKTRSQALQAAREELRSHNEFAHPYYWTGIELFE